MDKYNDIEEKVMLNKLKALGSAWQSHPAVKTPEENPGSLQHFDPLKEDIKTMGVMSHISANGLIVTNFKLLSRIVIFIKKTIRRCLKWYIDPVCLQQSNFNNLLLSYNIKLTSVLEQHDKEVLLQKTGLDNQKDQLEIQKNELGVQKDQLEIQKEQLEIQKTQLETQKDLLEIQKNELEKQKNEIAIQKNELEIRKNELEIHKNEFNTLSRELSFANKQIIQLTERINSINSDVFTKKEDNFWLSREVFAQSGEDVIVEYILMVLGFQVKECRYLDLGANHAKELSNTYSLYRKGARGVLVEANPALIPELKFYRHEDIIVNKCIASEDGIKIPLYLVNGDGLVSTSKESVEKALSINNNLKMEGIVEIEGININTLLDKYFVQGPELLSVDIEDDSLEALQAMDWEKFRPLIVIVEMIEYSTTLSVGYKNKEIQQFMEEKGYVEYAFTGINSIYLDSERTTGNNTPQ